MKLPRCKFAKFSFSTVYAMKKNRPIFSIPYSYIIDPEPNFQMTLLKFGVNGPIGAKPC